MNRTRKEMLKWLLVQREAGKQRRAQAKATFKKYPWYGKILMHRDYMCDSMAERAISCAIDIAIMRMESYWKMYYKYGDRFMREHASYPETFDVSLTSYGMLFTTTRTTRYNIQRMMEKYP